ncbi:MAG: hypothetical protein ACAI44_27080 [Candidatus Sericytochromatia bacterium]
MSNFSTRVGGPSQPIGTPQTEKVGQIDKPTPPPKPTKTKQLPPTPPPKPGQQTVIGPEKELALSQGIETTSSQTISKNSGMVPRVSGLTVQPEPEEPTPPDVHPDPTLLTNVARQNQAKELDGYLVVGQGLVKKITDDPNAPPPPPNQVTGMVMLGGNPDSLSVRGRVSVGNLDGSGTTLALSGGIAITRKDDYSGEDRVLQVRSKQAELSVGLSGKVGDTVPVSGSIGVGGGFDVAYSRKLKDGEKLHQARQTEPPSRGQIAKDPLGTLGPGDEIAFRGFLDIGVSVGAIEPNSGIKFSVGVDVHNEFITSIKRSEGDPPSFRLHIEPGNRSIDGKASVGWGPFAITGGVGYASTVYYEFDMSPEALQGFLKTGKLPELPDPSKYLRPGVVLTEETFKPFQDQARESGVSLVGFGATKSLNKSLELSATVGKVGTKSEKLRAIYVREGEVLREDVHTMSVSRSAWFRGELSTSLALKQSNQFTKVDGQDELQPRYVGLEASFKIADTQTGQEELQERVGLANQVLGRTLSNPLTLPERQDGSWGKSSVLVKANLSPEVIEKLVALDPESGNAKFQIAFMEREFGVPAKDVRELLKDLRELDKLPDKDVARREQGLRIAGFLASGYTSVVTDQELKRIAVLDRMLGGGVAELTVASTVHSDKLTSLGVEGFLSETRGERLSEISRSIGLSGHDLHDLKSRLSGKTWDRFNVAAQKLNALETLREDLVRDTLLDPKEKELLLKTVDEQLSGLGQLSGELLGDEYGRRKVLSGLLSAGSLLPKALYTSPEQMFDDPLVKGVFLDQVIGAAFLHDAPPTELAGLLTQISNQGKGSAGIEQVFKILSLAEVNGVQKQVLDAMEPEAIAELFPRMSREQQSALLTTLLEVTGVDKDRMDNIMTLIEKSREKSDKQFEKFKSGLSELDATLFELEGQLPKDKHLMDHFKQGYKEVDRPLQRLQTKIEDSRDVLGEVGHGVLQGQAQKLEQRLSEFYEQLTTLSPDQRQDLFKQVLRQDKIGEASQFMLRHMIGGSQTESELVGFAQGLQTRIRKSENSVTLPHQQGSVKEMRKALKECLLDVQLRLS